MNITHVVGTRFNIGKGLDEDWTRYRGQYLRRFAAASVKAQILQPAFWFVLVDIRTNQALLDDILGDLPCVVCKIKGQNGWATKFAKAVRRRVKTQWLSFTRLDSDDALHASYLADIDAAAEPKQEVLSFKGGLVTRLKDGRTCKLMKTTTNFQTTVERTATAKTGYCAAHGRLRSIYGMRVLHQFPRWLVVRHGRNDRGQLPFTPVPKRALEKHFGFLGLHS